MKVKITGTGSCLPKLRVTNDDLGQIMETSDEWIRSRTGIIARHIAVEETTTGMSTEAAGKALKNADISAEDVDIIIAATVSADKYLPGLLIGYISDVTENDTELTLSAKLTPTVDFQHLSNVLVIKQLKEDMKETGSASETVASDTQSTSETQSDTADSTDSSEEGE